MRLAELGPADAAIGICRSPGDRRIADERCLQRNAPRDRLAQVTA